MLRRSRAIPPEQDRSTTMSQVNSESESSELLVRDAKGEYRLATGDSSVPEFRIFASTNCGTLGRAGTYRRANRFMLCRNCAVGKPGNGTAVRAPFSRTPRPICGSPVHLACRGESWWARFSHSLEMTGVSNEANPEYLARPAGVEPTTPWFVGGFGLF